MNKIECPAAVVLAGARLMKLRKMAAALEAEIDAAYPDIKAAVFDVVMNHSARVAQAGEAFVLLRQAQTAHGNIAHAHDVLRRVLVECGIAEPTNEQVVAIISEMSAKKAAPDAGIESIR